MFNILEMERRGGKRRGGEMEMVILLDGGVMGPSGPLASQTAEVVTPPCAAEKNVHTHTPTSGPPDGPGWQSQSKVKLSQILGCETKQTRNIKQYFCLLPKKKG